MHRGTSNIKKNGYDSPYSPDIKAKSKKQLKEAYGVSKNMIPRWINMHLEAFQKIGYQKNQRILTPAQVALFEKIFGRADEDDNL